MNKIKRSATLCFCLLQISAVNLGLAHSHATADSEAPKYKVTNSKTCPAQKNGSMIQKVTASTSVGQQHYISAASLNRRLKNNLSGHANEIIEAAKKNGLDPAFFAAIICFETRWGTSHKVRHLNNPGGVFAHGHYVHFGSISQGIQAMAANLKARYVNRGICSISAIAHVYAPVGASNDPNGTNGQWPRSVTKIMNILIKGSVGV